MPTNEVFHLALESGLLQNEDKNLIIPGLWGKLWSFGGKQSCSQIHLKAIFRLKHKNESAGDAIQLSVIRSEPSSATHSLNPWGCVVALTSTFMPDQQEFLRECRRCSSQQRNSAAGGWKHGLSDTVSNPGGTVQLQGLGRILQGPWGGIYWLFAASGNDPQLSIEITSISILNAMF